MKWSEVPSDKYICGADPYKEEGNTNGIGIAFYLTNEDVDEGNISFIITYNERNKNGKIQKKTNSN